jgi:catechol 2,3-dioxygenase-like lactoylglutathione lyase family enzyme
LFRKLDNHLLRVADLDAAISFYQDKLGHRLSWRSDEAAGFALPETEAELVVHLKIGPETDILVRDPFGNELVLLDQSKGRLATDARGRVIGIEPRPTRDDDEQTS